jgi:hypothetical protein
MPNTPEELRQQRILAFQEMLTEWSQNYLGLIVDVDLDPNDEYLVGRILDEILGPGDARINWLYQNLHFYQPWASGLGSSMVLMAPMLNLNGSLSGFMLTTSASVFYELYSHVSNFISASINFDAIIGYLNAAQTPRLLQYKSLFDAGYLDEWEFFAWSGLQDWMDFYTRVGPDSRAIQLRTQRENGQITEMQLIQGMYLTNSAEVNEVLGMEWRLSMDLKDKFTNLGIVTSFTVVHDLVVAFREDFSSRSLFEMEAIADLCELIAVNDVMPENLADLYLAIDSIVPLEEGSDSILENEINNSMSLASYSVFNTPQISFMSPFFDTVNKYPTKKFAPSVNSDFIQSNVALAILKTEEPKIGVTSSFDDKTKDLSFPSISFASPFEKNI